MIRACLIANDLRVPQAGASAEPWAWSVLRSASAPGIAWTVLHTRHVDRDTRQDLQAACSRLNAQYVHIEDHPLPLEAPMHPPVEALRVGWHLIHALGTLRAEIAVFAGAASHAAIPLSAKRTGSGLPGCEIVVAVDELRELDRLDRDAFPELGREDIATDFLEREALASAGAALFARKRSLDWAQGQRWKLTNAARVFSEADLARDLRTLAEGLAQTSAEPALPTVTLCMPYFEQPRQLIAALEDIAAQTRPPEELIVVDDGSKSDEAKAAFETASRRFARPGWTFIRQENAGPAAARNHAARLATRDALLFCDSDNRYRPDMVETLARGFARTGSAAITSAFHAVREGADPASDPGYLFLPLGSCIEAAMFENTIADTNTLVDRRLFLEVEGFPGGSLVEDWRCYLRLLDRGHRVEVVPAPLFTYTISASSRVRSRGELAEASGAIAPYLESAHPAFQRAWPYVAGVIRSPRLASLEGQLADLRVRSELTAAASRTELRKQWAQAVLAEHERDEARARERRTLEMLESRTSPERAKIGDLEREQNELRRQLDESRRRLSEVETRLQQREEKLKRMQGSLSWALTAPLRSLRRSVIDPLRPAKQGDVPGEPSARPENTAVISSATPETQESTLYHYFIEAPHHWRIRGESFAVRGWCFYEDIEAPTGIRAKVGDRVFEGVHGLGRHDIAAIMPQWSQAARSGFRIEVLLRDEDRRLDLELRDEKGVWRRFVDIDLTAEPAAPEKGSYDHWVAAFDTITPAHIDAFRRRAERLSDGPLISVLMPVYNTDPRWLERALASVRAQVYPRWELCIADDASTDPRIKPILEKAAAAEPRIRVVFRGANGHICAATNSALELARGDVCALFDHDDELRPHSLLRVAEEFAAHADAELVYSDEDKIDELGRRFDPHFKPDWNPDLLRSQNYLCHLVAVRTDTLRSLGGMRAGFEGSQDWDLFLRLSERVPAASIRHIPRILYHWRAAPGSTAVGADQKDYAVHAARRALAEHYARTGVDARLEPSVGGHWRTLHPLPRRRPLVSIIIPTHNAADLVRLCVASLIARTDYEAYEILLVDNRSDDPAALELFERLERDGVVRLLRYERPFNYSAINNFAARQARGELLCLLNNDIEIRESGWLAEMASQALRSGIGAVGTRLLFPDLTVQHAGVVVGLGGVAGHGFKRFHRNEPGHQFRPHVVHNLSAVTAACLVIRKSVYDEVGGLDEAGLPVAFNDVDFCLRVQARGYRNLYTPFAEMIHHESATRGSDNTPEKVERFRREIEAIKARWGDSLLSDPAYNPNLSLDSEDYALAYPPRLPDLGQA